jgi:hypothetical protein
MSAEMRGTAQVIRNLGKIKERTFERIVAACQFTQAKVVNDARSMAPVHLTTLRQSILPGDIIVTRDNVMAKVVANIHYAAAVEFGSRPHFPPVDALKDWAAKKLGDEGLAFVVARSISQKGTRPQPFLGPALLKNQSTFRREIARAVKL